MCGERRERQRERERDRDREKQRERNEITVKPPTHTRHIYTYINTYIVLLSLPLHTHPQTHTHAHTMCMCMCVLCVCVQRSVAHPRFVFFCFLLGGHLVLGLASGLEAFSREPPCDGFGALAVRQTPETRGTAWEFLSYYPILPSRYLRDPFTISLFKTHKSTRTHIFIRMMCVCCFCLCLFVLWWTYQVLSTARRAQERPDVRFTRIIFFSQFPAK